jgi:hypothetical protein
MPQPTGATVLIKWHDDPEPMSVTFSLGTYDEETGTDGFGRPDDTVFFYIEDADVLDALKQHPTLRTDWCVVDYELEY